MTTQDATPIVSVIVPTHARRALLARLLATLQAQDWPADRYEIIVVHNHTPDGTDAMVAEAAAASRVPIHYFRTAFRRPGASRQYGAERARGDILAFIDDDCQATPGWMAAGVAGLRRGFALVQGRTVPDPAQPRRLLEKTVQVEGPSMFFETCNIFYDAEAFRAVGGFPEGFRELRSAEDTALGWAMREAGYRTGFAADALVHHEVFPVSLYAWLNAVHVVSVLPHAVRAYPSIRRSLFLGFFLTPLTAAFDAFALGVIGGILLHSIALVMCLPYLWLRFHDRGRFRAPHILLARFIFGLPRAAMMAYALLSGSLRARRLVL